jgi:MFS transporter, OPA family, solute carrier family 37 (glycerol-3-phosphate transporter), member 1/2
MVPETAITVFCLKLVRYSVYMWLPMYLLQQLNYSKENAGYFSTMFEIGGIVGSSLVGWILRKFFNNKTLLGSSVQAFLSSFVLIAFVMTSEYGLFINSLLMFIIGFLECSADIILCGSFPSELGEMDGRNAASAIVGFVNGFGTIGTFIQGPTVGYIVDKYGWQSMFYVYIVILFIGSTACYRAHRIMEIKKRATSILISKQQDRQSLLDDAV